MIWLAKPPPAPKLRRRDLFLKKSRIRDERDPRYGGYMIQDIQNRVTHGAHQQEFALSLDDGEWIAEDTGEP
jgi:hypothetical protein